MIVHHHRPVRSTVVGLIALGLLPLAGCSGESSQAPPTAGTGAAAASGAAAAKKATHGGTLVPLGNDTIGETTAQLEFVLDPDAGRLTMYILDAAAAKPLSTWQKDVDIMVQLMTDDGSAPQDAQPFKLTLKGATPSDVTEMSGQSDELKGARKFEGTFKIFLIGQMPFNGTKFKFPEGTTSKP